MSFFAILFALLIEQARPLAASNPIHGGLRAWCVSVSRNFDAGKSHHAWVAWCAAALVPALLALGVHWLLLWGVGWPFAVLWNVAVLYRMAEFVSRYWKTRSPSEVPRASVLLQQAAAKAWLVIDWLPARLTALCFAMVGSFEEAIEGWRFHAQHFPNDNDGVVLAATAGALNVRLGGEALKARVDALAQQGFVADADIGDSASTPGREPEIGHLRSGVGLVWRSVVVWMLLLALLTLARLLG